ncbi:MAG: hypothetical protein JO017_09625 [Actinobacteria bacterium]|nr:hypothetical protein [Actinomycetota bacterium]
MPPGDEQAWTDALAQEHLHQRELLATLRDELGAFARECTSALTALDALLGLAGVGEVVSAAQQAKAAADVGRRMRSADGPRLHDLFAAATTLDGQPASQAALEALQPLVKWFRGGDRRELLHSAAGDVAQVLAATAALGAGADTALAADASALGQSVRDAVEHVEGAAKSVREGKLAQVLAESRATLEADLDALRSVVERADEAPPEWKKARRDEHAELTDEVHTKLDRVEKIRAALFRLLPQLQTIARALGVVQRVHALEQRLDPAPVAAAQTALVLGAATSGRSRCRGSADGACRSRRGGRRSRPSCSRARSSASCSPSAAARSRSPSSSRRPRRRPRPRRLRPPRPSVRSRAFCR